MFGNPTKVAPFLDAAPSPLRSRPLTDDDPLSPSSLEGNLVPPTPDPKVKSEEDEKVDDEDFDKVQMNPKFSPFFPEQKPSSLQLDTGPSPRLGDDEVGERGMRGGESWSETTAYCLSEPFSSSLHSSCISATQITKSFLLSLRSSRFPSHQLQAS